MHTVHTVVAELQPYSVLVSLTKQDALKIFVLGFFFVCWRNAFWIHGKSIKNGQNWKGADKRDQTQVNRSFLFAISGMLWNTILCFERWQQWLWRPPEMGISRTVLGRTIWDFFSIRLELQVIRKGCITITTNTKPLAIRYFTAGTCWWSQTNSIAELRLGKEHMLNSEHFSFYRKMCTVVSFSRFQNNCGGYSAFPPTVINSRFGFYVYDFFVKFINGLQLQGAFQIKEQTIRKVMEGGGGGKAKKSSCKRKSWENIRTTSCDVKEEVKKTTKKFMHR